MYVCQTSLVPSAQSVFRTAFHWHKTSECARKVHKVIRCHMKDFQRSFQGREGRFRWKCGFFTLQGRLWNFSRTYFFLRAFFSNLVMIRGKFLMVQSSLNKKNQDGGRIRYRKCGVPHIKFIITNIHLTKNHGQSRLCSGLACLQPDKPLNVSH